MDERIEIIRSLIRELQERIDNPVIKTVVEAPEGKTRDQILREVLPERSYKKYIDVDDRKWNGVIDSFPFQRYTRPVFDLDTAKRVLDSALVGREREKRQLLAKYASYCYTGRLNRVIMLAGQPGTGKSALAKAFTKILGLPTRFINVPSITTPIALLGTEQHYSNSRIGILARTMIDYNTCSCTFVFDELDKVVKDSVDGSVESALLQVFDTTWSDGFIDRSMEVPIDISRCVMIATCNDLENLSEPMRDRLDVINFDKYSHREVKNILMTSVIPKLIKRYGIENQIVFGEEIVDNVLDIIPDATLRELENTVINILDISLLCMNGKNAQRPFVVSCEQVKDAMYAHNEPKVMGF